MVALILHLATQKESRSLIKRLNQTCKLLYAISFIPFEHVLIDLLYRTEEKDL